MHDFPMTASGGLGAMFFNKMKLPESQPKLIEAKNLTSE
jgi:hypothetical protein